MRSTTVFCGTCLDYRVARIIEESSDCYRCYDCGNQTRIIRWNHEPEKKSSVDTRYEELRVDEIVANLQEVVKLQDKLSKPKWNPDRLSPKERYEYEECRHEELMDRTDPSKYDADEPVRRTDYPRWITAVAALVGSASWAYVAWQLVRWLS